MFIALYLKKQCNHLLLSLFVTPSESSTHFLLAFSHFCISSFIRFYFRARSKVNGLSLFPSSVPQFADKCISFIHWNCKSHFMLCFCLYSSLFLCFFCFKDRIPEILANSFNCNFIFYYLIGYTMLWEIFT